MLQVRLFCFLPFGTKGVGGIDFFFLSNVLQETIVSVAVAGAVIGVHLEGG